jgi:GDP-L-fucose synthase
MDNLLITGSNGFIGRNLTEYFKTQYKIFTPHHNNWNLLNEKKLLSYVIKKRIDYIIHCANLGGERNAEFENVLGINLRMFFNIIKAKKYVKKIIYFGSGAEYNKMFPIQSVSENDFGVNIPTDDYGFYKYVCAKFIEQNIKTDIICLRLFGIYGRYENYRLRFISNAIVKNLFHFPIDMKQNVFFDYLYIDDLCRIVEFVLKNQTKFNIYNTASGKRTSLLAIAKMINNISNFKSAIFVEKAGYNNEYTASNVRLVSELPKFIFTTIGEGVEKLFEWYKNNLSNINRDEIYNQSAQLINRKL